MRSLVRGGAALFLCAAVSVGAQQRPVTFVRDTSLNLSELLGVKRFAVPLVGRDGRMIVTSEWFFGDVIALDSAWHKTSWKLELGGRDEIANVQRWGWSGDSIWVVDRVFNQVAMLGKDAKVKESVGFPSWVRPTWGDRRQYPWFSNATLLAMFADGSLLVEPSGVRRFFDTPGYNPDLRLFLRVDRDGRILRTVAQLPPMDGRVQLRSGTERKSYNVPNFPRTAFHISSDAERIAIVQPIGSDSGAFRVTALNGSGDTVVSKRYVVDANRVDRAVAGPYLKSLQALGRYSADQVRDTIARLMPQFNSPVVSVVNGIDHSVWIWIRRPGFDAQKAEWFVLDSLGNHAFTTLLPRQIKVYASRLDRLWSTENDRVKMATTLVTYRRSDLTSSPRSRSGSSSGTSSRAPRPE